MLLHLETAGAVCSAALSHNGQLLAYKESAEPRAHAAVLTIFIAELLAEVGIDAYGVDAVSISSGPGSYTGLRIASSVAKGFCYAASKPLIALDTLSILAQGFIEDFKPAPETLICPMIDARRDEVFTAVFSQQLHVVLNAAPVVLTAEWVKDLLSQHKVNFVGDGCAKFNAMIGLNANAGFFPAFYAKALHQITPATQKFDKQQFEDVAYFEPNYLKEFYTTATLK
jgi:tRNA threonylcarbamoyladenosine biosynthesis protein TsaB